jgi:HD-GYP domain-containing protein (c-di-GMP phosphodiesterase class II)
MISHVGIRSNAWWRIALVSLTMSVLLGLAQYFYHMELLDDQIVARAANESPQASRSLQLLIADNKSAADTQRLRALLKDLQHHFSIVELYDLDKKKWLDEVSEGSEWVEDGLKNLSAHGFGLGDTILYRRLLLSDTWFWQIVLPLKNKEGNIEGYFEGVYHLNKEEEASLYHAVVFSVAMVVLATLATGLTMYPLLIRLTRGLEQQSQAVLMGNVELMEVLGEAIARRDSDTNIHNYRVTLYAIRLAEKLNYERNKMPALVAGSFLHDVGKIGISDAILLKPGKLTDDEFLIMKTHVSIGAQILARASWLASARDIPQYHHEKYDGSGYLSGLIGEEIPLSARIFAVVDVFDALTADRPYKKAMPLEQALSILEKGAGNHFDPHIVHTFIANATDWYQAVYTLPAEQVEAEVRRLVMHYFS